MEEEYLVLECPACERDVKIKADSAGVRMGCPYCRAPLEIAESEPEEVLEEAIEASAAEAKPKVRLPLVFRQLRKDDVALVSDQEFADEYERRRLPFEAPAWDEEARGAAGGGASEAVEMDADVPGGATPLTRPGGKTLLTRKEHVFRNVKIMILTVSIATAAVISYSAIIRTFNVVRKDEQTKKEVPEDMRKKMAEAHAEKVAQEEAIPRFITSAEEEAAVAVVRGFLDARSIEDRLPYVRHPLRVEPLMREWYAREPAVTEWPEGKVLKRDKHLDQGRYFIRLYMDFVGIGRQMFILKQTRDSLTLDWETATGYQPKPLAEFKAEHPTTPVEFRVKLKRSDYYNFKFIDRDVYQSVELSYPGQPEFRLFGYIQRSRPWASAVIKRLEAGEGPSFIVELQYPTGEIQDDRQVEIFSIISESWWL